VARYPQVSHWTRSAWVLDSPWYPRLAMRRSVTTTAALIGLAAGATSGCDDPPRSEPDGASVAPKPSVTAATTSAAAPVTSAPRAAPTTGKLHVVVETSAKAAIIRGKGLEDDVEVARAESRTLELPPGSYRVMCTGVVNGPTVRRITIVAGDEQKVTCEDEMRWRTDPGSDRFP